jgi:predicted PurR-regulated permease PerM
VSDVWSEDSLAERLKSRRAIFLALFALTICVFLIFVRGILAPFILAAFLSYVLEPPVSFFQRRGMSRSGAIGFVYLVIFTAVVLIGLYFVPRFFQDLGELSQAIPGYVKRVQEFSARTYRLSETYNIPKGFTKGVTNALTGLEAHLVNAGEKSVQYVFSSATLVSYLFLAPVIAFYILRDINKWRHKAVITMAGHPLPYVDFVRDVDRVFAGFIRGQSLVALFVATMVWMLSIVLGLKFGAVLGVISGLGEFIPYFGPAIGNLPLLVTAFLKSPVTGLWALALVAIIQWFDSSIMVPRVTGARVGLHPLWVIFAIFAGGELFGFWGIFLAVPLAGIIRVLFGFVKAVVAGQESGPGD